MAAGSARARRTPPTAPSLRLPGRAATGSTGGSRDRVVVVDRDRGGWDRGAMSGYGFRQTARGATLRLEEDVLFKTDSDVLRPGAIEKLRPLASYLRAEPGVRVAIDGYTDSRGTDAHNQDLSGTPCRQRAQPRSTSSASPAPLRGGRAWPRPIRSPTNAPRRHAAEPPASK